MDDPADPADPADASDPRTLQTLQTTTWRPHAPTKGRCTGR